MNNSDVVTIGQIKTLNGQRVVTFKDIDMVHGKKDGTARRNFNRNKKHFVNGVDYVVISPNETICPDSENSNETMCHIKGLGVIPNRGITVLMESGYLMIAKCFDDDLSWDVQRQLVNGYFKAKESYTEKSVNVETFPEVRTRTPIIPTATPAPRNQNWFQKNNRRMGIICNKANLKRSTLYHHILLRIGEVFDIDRANVIYEEENGHQPEYAIDIVSYFKEMAEVADDYLDRVEEFIQKEQSGGV